MNEDSIKANILLDQTESIKLMKMSKGYQWEIKIMLIEGDNKVLERIKKINDELRNEYGSGE